jgi:hypothetical protein
VAINKVAKDIIEKFNITTFVETGIYQSLTAGMVYQYFKDLGVDDFSMYEVDIHAPYVAMGSAKYPDKRIEFVESDSVKFLDKHVEDHFDDPSRHLFFLDAHVHIGIGSNPLFGEIDAILRMENNPIIMIDDFANPLDGTHNWIYGPDGKPLGIESIRNQISSRTDIVYYPIDGEHESQQGQAIIFVDEYRDDLDDMLSDIAVMGSKL